MDAPVRELQTKDCSQQQNERALQAEIGRQIQKADAVQHASLQAQQDRNALEERLKNVKSARCPSEEEEMLRCTLIRVVSFIGAATLVLATAAQAQKVKLKSAQPSVNFLSGETGQVNNKIEASAVEPGGGEQHLIVADDESKNLVVVEAATGKIKQRLAFNSVEKKPKWEAMARDDEGAYYIVGSHSVKDPTEPDAPGKLKAHSHLFRFRLKDSGADGKTPVIDEASIIEWDITDALTAAGYSLDPQQNKVKVEGLAVRTLHGPKDASVRELAIGLREPGEPVSAYVADITQLPPTKSKLALKPLFKFTAGDLDGIHSRLSSLEYISPPGKAF
jgi:hypothetical protein